MSPSPPPRRGGQRPAERDLGAGGLRLTAQVLCGVPTGHRPVGRGESGVTVVPLK